jgi:hypothetical protein
LLLVVSHQVVGSYGNNRQKSTISKIFF